MCWNIGLPNSTQCNGHYAVQGHRFWYQFESSYMTSYILVINTNLPPTPFPSYGWLLVKFSLARGECLTLTLSLGVIPCQYRHKWYIFGLHSTAESIGVFSTIFTQSAPKASEFVEITRRLGLLRRPRSPSLVPIESSCDFLLVINTNLAHILHPFRDIAFDRSKIAIIFGNFGYRLVFNSPDGGVPLALGRSP